MSETNNNFKKSQSNQTFLTIVVVAVVTLVVALYKINHTQERFESKKAATAQNVSQKREQVMDKYVNDYAEGAAWALKNEIVEPEACDEAGNSSVGNLGCIAVAAELRDKIESELAHEMARAEAEDALEVEQLSPEDAMYNEAYLEPETN